MSVYKGNGGVTTVALGYTSCISSHKKHDNDVPYFGPFSTYTTEVPNTQVHIINADQIEFKVALNLIQNANICSYNGVIWVLDSYTQTSTGYVTSTWTFAPMLTYRKILISDSNNLKINGIATSTVNLECELLNPSELPNPVDVKKASNRELFNSNLYFPTFPKLIIRLALPAKLRTANTSNIHDVGATSIVKNSILATGDIYLVAEYTNVGHVSGTSADGISLLLASIANDEVYAGCIADIYVSDEPYECWVDTKSTITIEPDEGENITLSIYKPTPIGLRTIKLDELKTSKPYSLYTRDISVRYGDNMVSKSLYELYKIYSQYTSIENDRKLFVYAYPAMSSEGGKYVITFGEAGDYSSDYSGIYKQQIIAEFTRQCIGLQPIVNQYMTWWQSNKNRYETGLALQVGEAVFSVLASLLGGARQLLEATSAGAVGLVSKVATKVMLESDLSAISMGSAGAGSMWDMPLMICMTYFTNEEDYQNLIYLNPPSVNVNVTNDDYLNSTSPIYTTSTNKAWIQGYFNIESSYLTGRQKQQIAEMLQQGLSINYNVGVGYQGA